MLRRTILVALFILSGNLAAADAQPQREATHEPSRGELLYTMHCIACHNTQVHWRDRKVATDWTSLRTEVVHWQKVSGLTWSDDDVTTVTRYLNALHYHYPQPD